MTIESRVLYLLPGLLCDETIWASQQQELIAAGIEVRIPNYQKYSSIEDMASMVLMEAPVRFSVAGHSMGGRVAMEIVRTAPERVSRLSLLDTGMHPRQPGEEEKRRALIQLAYEKGMAALADRWLPGMVDPRRIDDEGLMRPLKAMIERMTPELFERQVHALLNRPNAAATLNQTKCPVLLGVGRQDVWSPLSQHQAMASLLPLSELVIFEDSGHMSPVEAPSAVTQALSKWFLMSSCFKSSQSSTGQ